MIPMTTTPTTLAAETLVTRLRAVGIPRRISRARVDHAALIASVVLTPLVPAGTLAWLVEPEPGESLRAYATRAAECAAIASAWAGGLLEPDADAEERR